MRIALWLGLGGVVAGCGFSAPASQLPADPDGGTDGRRLDAALPPDGCGTFSSLFDTCTLRPEAPGPLVIAATDKVTFDTTDLTMTSSTGATPGVPITAMTTLGGQMVAVVVTGQLTFAAGAELHAHGNLPLVMIVYGDAQLGDGALVDLAAGGAGHRSTCAGGPTAGTNSTGGGSGGGGAGFGAAGGPGGDSNRDGSSQTGGRAGDGEPLPAGLVGGCTGAHGGDGDDNGGNGGKGGGAFYLAAYGALGMSMTAAIDVGGEGGQGGDWVNTAGNDGDAGAGGGGSGGMIWLEAAQIGGGIVVANGGGGGEGSDAGGKGEDGTDGRRSAVSAPGGSAGPVGGGNGGSGGNVDVNAGGVPEFTASTPTGGGGGGGGSVGYIRVRDRSGTPPVFTVASPRPVIDGF